MVPRGAEFVCPECAQHGGIQIKPRGLGVFKYLVIAGAAVLLVLIIRLLWPPPHKEPDRHFVVSSTPIPLPPIPVATPTPLPPIPTPTPPVESTVLTLHGSSVLADTLIPTLIEGFVKQEGDTRIEKTVSNDTIEIKATFPEPSPTQVFDIVPENTTLAFLDLTGKKCDIALASRKVAPDEADHLRDAGLGDMTTTDCEHIVALDALAVIVHPNNPISELSKAQLTQIFNGQITDWSRISGYGNPIRVCTQSEDSDSAQAFRSLVLGGANVASTARTLHGSKEVSDTVCSDPNAIGFVELPSIGNARSVAISSGGMVSLLPDQFDIATEDYALSRRLYLYTAASPQNPLASRFVSFALSKDGQQAVEKTRFVAMRVGTGKSRIPAGAPAEYSGLVKDSDRLNVDFRFQTASSKLDNKALLDLDRVVDLLQNSPNKGRYILLVGFADSTGTPPLNLTLSKARANTVAQQLRQRGISPAVITGFGQEVPVDSNDTEQGRERNRRVEVWLRQ